MRNKWFIGLGVVASLLALLLIIVEIQPADFRVSRSATMAAPPAAVFAQVNDFHKWEGWSPWAKLDPDAKVAFDGEPAGKGAKFSWSGNDKVGAGQQTILETRPEELIQIKLDFERPFKDTCTTEFAFKPVGDKTEVTWTMFGKRNFLGKAFSLLMDCDKMIGPDFEKGLASMKANVEAAQPTEAVAATAEPEKKVEN